MTIYEIKKACNSGNSFFDKSWMRFFGQTLKDFTVKRLTEAQKKLLQKEYQDCDCYLISAPSYYTFGECDGEFAGTTKRIFVKQTGELINCPGNL